MVTNITPSPPDCLVSRFVSALVASQTGKEDAFFEEMGEVAKLRPEWSNMARHASWIRADPEQDPYSHYRHAVDADRKDRNLYILLGRYRDGPPKRNLPRPAEWILGVSAAGKPFEVTLASVHDRSFEPSRR